MIMAAKVAKGSVRKSKPIVAKTSLNSPYSKMWTPVVGEDMQFILKTLTEKFTQFGLKKVNIQKKFTKKSKKGTSDGSDKNPGVAGEKTAGVAGEKTAGVAGEKTAGVAGEKTAGENSKEQAAKPSWTLSDIHKHLAIGINEVIRALEKNEVQLVIVCKSAKPQMITEHISVLSASRGVFACQLPRLSENVAPVLGLKSVLALGFRNASDLFLEEVAAIIPRVPPLNVPWLTGNAIGTKENTADNEGTGEENKKGVTSRKRKHPQAVKALHVQLQSLKVKKIIPNPNKKRKIKVKKVTKKK